MNAIPRYTKAPATNERPDDFFEIEVGGRRAAVFRPLRLGKRLETYYMKGYIGKRQILRSTGYTTKGLAKEVAQRLWRTALDGRWDALEGAKLRQPKPGATIGDVIREFDAKIQDFNLTLKPSTAAGYVGALKGMVRRVRGEEWERVPASALGEELIEQYFAAHVKEAGEDLLERDRRIRGANSTLRNARAMFSEVAMKCYRGLAMPDLRKWMTCGTPEAAAVEHGEISTATIAWMAEAAMFLRDEDPAVYLAHLLFRHLGMRNDEIENARREWIEPGEAKVWLPNGKCRKIAGVMAIKRRSYWAPKRSSGEVPIDPEVMAEILSLAGEEYLIPARHVTERAEIVDRLHSEFVRPWVEGHQKTSYELRRWAATVVARRQGDEFADRFLRHSAKSTAGKHYLTGHALVAPITFEDCGL